MDRAEVFPNSNQALAFALAVAGCPFATAEENGPATNTYSVGFLSRPRIQAILRGLYERTGRRWEPGKMKIEEAIRLLIENGTHGDVTYMHKRCPIQAEVIKAWDELSDEFRNAEAEGREPNIPAISPTVVAQVLFVAANSEKEFKRVPFLNRMLQLASTLTGSTSKDNNTGRETTTGAGKVWSIFGSQKMKAHLGV